jgi:hypothetical protein
MHSGDHCRNLHIQTSVGQFFDFGEEPSLVPVLVPHVSRTKNLVLPKLIIPVAVLKINPSLDPVPTNWDRNW